MTNSNVSFTGHYAHFHAISNLSALLSHQSNRTKHKIFVCDLCHTINYNKIAHNKHKSNCINMKFSTTNYLPDKCYSTIKYKNFYKQTQIPYIAVADIETFITSNNDYSSVHTAASIGLMKCCLFNDKNSKYYEFFGPDCINNFFNKLKEIAIEIYDTCLSSKAAATMIFTKEDKRKYKSEKMCPHCNKIYSNEVIKVRDHDHVSGRFRSSLCSICNLNFKLPFPFLPVWFHNGSKFDFHFLAKHFPKGSKIEVTPKTKENYITMSWKIPLPYEIIELPDAKHTQKQKLSDTLPPTDMTITFLDSFRFLPASLDTLVKILPKDKLIITKKYMKVNNNNVIIDEFLTKNIYPYEYMDSWDKYKLPLPPKDCFYSKLKGQGITDDEYNFVKKSFKLFGCKNLKDFTLCYNKLDVTLLTDVIVNLIQQGIKEFNLDPSHFVSAPSYAYECALKMTNIKLEVFHKGQEDMYEFINNSIRGGISTLGSIRNIKANNKYMGEEFNPDEITNYILYLDKNSLYGSIMLNCKLPTGGFKWVSQKLLNNWSYFINFPSNANQSFFLECDFKYDEKLHDAHQNLPFLAENIIPPNSNQKKLILNLYDKYNYVLHLEHFKIAIKYGLILKKIHRALQFEQSNWLYPYIKYNLDKRRLATNEFLKMYYKLQINSVFGKMLQRNEDNINVKFVTEWCNENIQPNKKRNNAQSLISSPLFHSVSIFNENLAAIQMVPKEILLNRPKFVGHAILELSKVSMYKFYYEVLQAHYNINDLSLGLTDTDSFIIEIKNDEDVFKNFIAKYAQHFDTSNLNQDVFPFMPIGNKNVPGKMKIEYSNNIIREFIALRPKLYSFIMKDYKEYCKAKGVNYAGIRKLTFNNYMECFKTQENKLLTLYQIMSKLHTVITKQMQKIALNDGDDKRYYLSSNSSLPYGHYSIRNLHERIGSKLYFDT